MTEATVFSIELHQDFVGPEPRIEAGRGWTPNRKPDLVGVVRRGETPVCSIGIFATASEYACFQETLAWCGWVVIGYGHSVYFFDPATSEGKSHWLDESDTAMPYFGHLYPGEDFLLVATGSNLIRFDPAANQVWVTRDLGIDGVLVQEIRNGIIHGDGDWDPPGGWLPFTVDLLTGNILDGGHPPG